MTSRAQWLVFMTVALSGGCSSNGSSAPKFGPHIATENAVAQGSQPTDEILVVPGVSIGGVRLGMAASDLSTLGIDWQPEVADRVSTVFSRDPYRVVSKSGTVWHVAIKLTPNAKVSVAGLRVNPVGTLQDLAQLFPKCGMLEHAEGGNRIACGGGTTVLAKGSGSDYLEIQLTAP
jgi:hypothetical protein